MSKDATKGCFYQASCFYRAKGCFYRTCFGTDAWAFPATNIPTGTQRSAHAKRHCERSPPVVCQLTSQAYYTPGSQDEAYVMKQHVPPASVCDYLMVDVPQSPNGSYNQWSYSFLLQRNTSGHRFLFTVDMSGVNMVAKIRAIQSANFDQGTMQLQHSLWPGRLVGYGTLHGWTIPHTQRDYTTSKNLLELIYKRFAQAIQSSGTDEKDVTNFFAFKPRVNRTTNIDYVNFVNMLNELNNLRLVIMLTISDEDQLVVMPSSAWNHICQPLNDEPQMSTAVDLIADIAHPKVTFTLTISLRLDIFHDVNLAELSDYSLPRVNSNGHDAQCERQLFGRDPTGSSILDVRSGSCAFAWGPSQQSEVITFETPRTIRTKVGFSSMMTLDRGHIPRSAF
ncbi:hypothetical protein MRX96_026183 [Rhipicephalus microplus]